MRKTLIAKIDQKEGINIDSFKYNPDKLFTKRYASTKEALEERTIIPNQ